MVRSCPMACGFPPPSSGGGSEAAERDADESAGRAAAYASDESGVAAERDARAEVGHGHHAHVGADDDVRAHRAGPRGV